MMSKKTEAHQFHSDTNRLFATGDEWIKIARSLEARGYSAAQIAVELRRPVTEVSKVLAGATRRSRGRK